MPSTALSQQHRDASTSAKSANLSNLNFDFPVEHHLLITTEQNVCCWSKKGLTAIFKSNSGGILAAREGKGGRLALADSQNVLIHDVGRGMDRSYRLKGTEVRYENHIKEY